VTNMSNKLVELLEAEKTRLIKNADADMYGIKDKYIQLLESRIQSMIIALQLPEGRGDVVTLLEKGGILKVAELDATYDRSRFQVEYDGRSVFGGYADIMIKKGKYRITLIIEPVEEQP